MSMIIDSKKRAEDFVDISYELPKAIRIKFLESAKEYLIEKGQEEQLAFILELIDTCLPSNISLHKSNKLSPASQRRSKHNIAFGWYGGKFNHLNWLLNLLPQTHHYCEPFGGSAAVLLNREPSPVETYNDLDGEVVNFFRVLRDNTDELIKAIALTPFSRE